MLFKPSEVDFIENIKDKFSSLTLYGSTGIGDDCSVIPFDENNYQLTTTDLLLENIHFLTEKISGAQLGYKSLMVNLSDIAAMGGVPKQAYLSLGIPQGVSNNYISNFINSFHKTCEEHKLALMGGDTTRSKNGLIINITIQGLVEKNKLKLRSKAKPGDLICVTTKLGDPAIGLEVLLNNLKTTNDEYFIKKHLEPPDQILQGQFLANITGVTSMIDISDGIATDLNHICKQSNLSAEINLQNIPLSDEYSDTCKINGLDLYHKALCGGEDYGLLFTINKNQLKTTQDNYKNTFKQNIHPIGFMTKVINKSEINYLNNYQIIKNKYAGFDHFEKTKIQEPIKKYNRVLTIAGSDSGGGAGIQADIKTISHLGGYPTTALTCITAQNTLGVQGLLALPTNIIKEQISSILNDIGTDTIKIGLLANREIIESVAEELSFFKSKNNKDYKLILDPVMVATSGDLLLEESALNALITNLIPLAYLITPNLFEAEILTKSKITTDLEIKTACMDISKLGVKNVLIKCGHGSELSATDTLYITESNSFFTFNSEKINTENTHCTGCTLSSAIATYLARDYSLRESIEKSKQFIQQAIIQGSQYKLGKGAGPLNFNN